MNTFTPEKQEIFIQALSNCPNVTAACEAAKISRVTVYNHRKRDEKFKAAWDEAVDIGVDALEDEAIRRAHDGVDEPVFYQGAQCGTVRKYSDVLMMFTLKARRPEKFRERTSTELSGANGGAIEVADATPMDAARRVAFLLAGALAAPAEAKEG